MIQRRTTKFASIHVKLLLNASKSKFLVLNLYILKPIRDFMQKQSYA